MSQEITAEEVAKHNTPESLWIIIDGNVYDVTEWQKDHPGGKKMLQKVGGKDATKFFHKYHDVDNVMRKFGVNFRIGKLSANPAVAQVPTMASVIENKKQDAMVLARPTASVMPNSKSVGLRIRQTAAEEDELSSEVPPIGDRFDQYGDMIPYADPLWYQGFYSPYHNESHVALRERFAAYVEEKLTPFIDEWEEKEEIPAHVYREFGEAGWLALQIPRKTGFVTEYATNKHADIIPDRMLDAFHSSILIDELCRVGSGALVWHLVGGFGIGCPPILKYAQPDVKKRVLPQIFSGQKRACLCITEPSGGSDVANLETTAEKTADGKHFIVNGTKKWITNGIWADFFSVAVRTGGEGSGMNGISMLLIEKDMPGVSVRKIHTQGMRMSGSAFIEFEDVKVPVGNLLGKENGGFKVVMANFNPERMGCIAQANRFARVCYEDAVKWAHQRETFGKKLIKHDVIRQKLALMACRIEGSCALYESLVYQLSQMDEDEAMLRLGGNIAGAKALATQTFEWAAREASQIFGGLSYTRGGKGGRVERLYRDVRALAIPGGSEEIMLDLSMRQSLKVNFIMGAKL